MRRVSVATSCVIQRERACSPLVLSRFQPLSVRCTKETGLDFTRCLCRPSAAERVESTGEREQKNRERERERVSSGVWPGGNILSLRETRNKKNPRDGARDIKRKKEREGEGRIKRGA